jgi:hypothetical protein
MAKGKVRKGTRKAADMKIADAVEKNLDLKKAETLFERTVARSRQEIQGSDAAGERGYT